LDGKTEEDIVVRVGSHTLSRRKVMELVPKNLSGIDSLLAMEGITRRWIKDVLVYETALKNIGSEEQEILRMVEDYRRSLICYRYQEQLIREKLSVELSEGEKVLFYEENRKEFPLAEAIVRGLFLKVPLDAPNLQELRRIYKDESEETLEVIEKSSMQSPIHYDYFYDRWQSFEEVMRSIPIQVRDADAFLVSHRSVEVSDGRYCYLLHIGEYMLSGATAPYDFVSEQITLMLMHRRKAEFLRSFENDLYETAISHGKVHIYEDQ
jgi:hypothetical protein